MSSKADCKAKPGHDPSNAFTGQAPVVTQVWHHRSILEMLKILEIDCRPFAQRINGPLRTRSIKLWTTAFEEGLTVGPTHEMVTRIIHKAMTDCHGHSNM